MPLVVEVDLDAPLVPGHAAMIVPVRLRLTLEYDGTDFRGWAAQPGLRTVEGELRGLSARCTTPSTSLAVAGRTDTGVHALGQVVERRRRRRAARASALPRP